MSSKHLQFFMMPAEFAEFAESVLPALELEVIGGIEGPGAPPKRRPRYIGPRGVTSAAAGDVRPAREGWLIATLPSLEGEKLYLAEIAAKTDWDDPTTNLTTENPTVLRLFERVARPLRRKLVFPVTATNELTGKSEDYKAIGYSEGARRWLDDRGQWRQEGVKNIRFSAK
jgi:hypothetical protein